MQVRQVCFGVAWASVAAGAAVPRGCHKVQRHSTLPTPTILSTTGSGSTSTTLSTPPTASTLVATTPTTSFATVIGSTTTIGSTVTSCSTSTALTLDTISTPTTLTLDIISTPTTTSTPSTTSESTSCTDSISASGPTSRHQFAQPPGSPAGVATAEVLTRISNIEVSTPTPKPNPDVASFTLTSSSAAGNASLIASEPARPSAAGALAYPGLARRFLPLNSTSTTGNATSGAASAQPSQLFAGPESAYPAANRWVDFDTLWALNQDACNRPTNGGLGATIKQDVQQVAGESGVDPRLILAVIMQESSCELHVPSTVGAVPNTGLMQAFNGAIYNGSDSSILQMIRDGARGTAEAGGSGLQQYTQRFGVFSGLRAYNSGPSGIDFSNLNSLPAGTGVPLYCSDIANRLTGAMI